MLWEPAYYQLFLHDALGFDCEALPDLAYCVGTEGWRTNDKRVALGISGAGNRWPDAFG